VAHVCDVEEIAYLAPLAHTRDLPVEERTDDRRDEPLRVLVGPVEEEDPAPRDVVLAECFAERVLRLSVEATRCERRLPLRADSRAPVVLRAAAGDDDALAAELAEALDETQARVDPAA